MKKKIIFMLILLCWVPYNIYAIDDSLKKKYPYSVLTNDYGILNEKDLNDDFKPPIPFSPKNISGYIYWQCYPRDNVTITLKDIGYSSQNISDNDGELTITVYRKSGILHKYSMRRNWPVMGVEKKFNRWMKLMKNEKYVCLAGSSAIREDKIMHGQKQQVYFWTFEKIKTKKGCDSYFDGDCNHRR